MKSALPEVPQHLGPTLPIISITASKNATIATQIIRDIKTTRVILSLLLCFARRSFFEVIEVFELVLFPDPGPTSSYEAFCPP